MDTKKSIAPILIFSSVEKIKERINFVSYLARRAYLERDHELLATTSEELLNLSPYSENIGKYFQAFVRKQDGQTEAAIKSMAELSNASEPMIRAGALLFLGLEERDSENLSDAVKLIRQSYEIAISQNPASLIALHCQDNLSMILSMQGAHRESLEVLKLIYPISKQMEQFFPAQMGNALNGLAYETYKNGEFAIAKWYSARACALPSSVRFPEYFETKAEIENQINQKASRSFISLSGSYEHSQILEHETRKSGYTDWRFVIGKASTDAATILKVRKAMWDGCSDASHIAKETGLDYTISNSVFNALKELDTLRTIRVN